MKNRMLNVGVVVGALMLPVAAHAQVMLGTATGAVLGGPAGAVVGGTIGAINAAAFTDYVAARNWPAYVYNSDVVVGAELPSSMLIYDVPAYYRTPLYYTVVNNHTVLVDPNTRKITQVIN